MAVAFDSASEGTGASPLTIAHTTSGSDRVLYVKVTHTSGDSSVTAITDVTYNGVSCALKFEEVPNRECAVYRLVAPATGANNVVVTWTGGSNMYAIVESYTGVDQTTPDDAHTTIDAGGTSASGSTSSAVGDMVTDCVVSASGITGLTVGASQTETHQQIGAGTDSMGASYEAGAASVTMSWSWTGFSSYGHWRWNIRQSSGGGPAANDALLVIRRA